MKEIIVRAVSLVLIVFASVSLSLPAKAATWIVDPSRSHIFFSGTQTGAPFKGEFKRFDATIDFDPTHPESGKAKVVIDVASATTGEPQRDEAMPQSDWFDAAKFPKAVFDATSFTSKGGNAFDAVGTLAIRSASKAVVLPFTLTVTGDTAHAVGRVQLLRSAYGVGIGPWATDKWVAFEVDVDIDLIAKGAP